MLDHSITFENEVQRCQRAPAVDHVILRDDLEPVHYRPFLEDVGVMRNPQTETNPVFREPVKSIRWHILEKQGPSQERGSPPGDDILFVGRGIGAFGGAGALTL